MGLLPAADLGDEVEQHIRHTAGCQASASSDGACDASNTLPEETI
jgi:hypothetical protein